jgi:hypothetical protein
MRITTTITNQTNTSTTQATHQPTDLASGDTNQTVFNPLHAGHFEIAEKRFFSETKISKKDLEELAKIFLKKLEEKNPLPRGITADVKVETENNTHTIEIFIKSNDKSQPVKNDIGKITVAEKQIPKSVVKYEYEFKLENFTHIYMSPKFSFTAKPNPNVLASDLLTKVWENFYCLDDLPEAEWVIPNSQGGSNGQVQNSTTEGASSSSAAATTPNYTITEDYSPNSKQSGSSGSKQMTSASSNGPSSSTDTDADDDLRSNPTASNGQNTVEDYANHAGSDNDSGSDNDNDSTTSSILRAEVAPETKHPDNSQIPGPKADTNTDPTPSQATKTRADDPNEQIVKATYATFLNLNINKIKLNTEDVGNTSDDQATSSTAPAAVTATAQSRKIYSVASPTNADKTSGTIIIGNLESSNAGETKQKVTFDGFKKNTNNDADLDAALIYLEEQAKTLKRGQTLEISEIEGKNPKEFREAVNKSKHIHLKKLLKPGDSETISFHKPTIWELIKAFFAKIGEYIKKNPKKTIAIALLIAATITLAVLTAGGAIPVILPLLMAKAHITMGAAMFAKPAVGIIANASLPAMIGLSVYMQSKIKNKISKWRQRDMSHAERQADSDTSITDTNSLANT